MTGYQTASIPCAGSLNLLPVRAAANGGLVAILSMGGGKSCLSDCHDIISGTYAAQPLQAAAHIHSAHEGAPRSFMG